jgi:hypothetical protein
VDFFPSVLPVLVGGWPVLVSVAEMFNNPCGPGGIVGVLPAAGVLGEDARPMVSPELGPVSETHVTKPIKEPCAIQKPSRSPP